MAGRHWYVKKEHERLWLVVYSVVGLAILMGAMFLIGTVGR